MPLQYPSKLRFASLAGTCVLLSSFAASAITACSVESVTPAPPAADDEPTEPGPTRSDGGGILQDVDAAEKPQTKPDASEPVPTAPFFDVTVNGAAVKVKSVTVKPTNVYPSQGISHYEIKATLEQTPPIVPGMQNDPSIVIRVGKDENGSDSCKEKRGPRDGFIEPVIELREVGFNYKRFTGQSTVIAFPTTTKSGSCTMLLKSAAAGGQSWGEASGTVQSGSDEPALAFKAKWFQTFTWPK